MNRLKKEIFKKGRVIGTGSSRVAFLLNGKVWKIPYTKSGSYQSRTEKEVYTLAESKQFFPDPTFFGNVCHMDRVVVSDQIPFPNYFEREMENLGVDIYDIFGNSRNSGYCPKTGEMKILDWGLLKKGWLSIDNGLDYKRFLKKRMKRWSQNYGE